MSVTTMFIDNDRSAVVWLVLKTPPKPLGKMLAKLSGSRFEIFASRAIGYVGEEII